MYANLCKYNADTDSLDIYQNGKLIGSLPCGFKKIIFSLTSGKTGWIKVKAISNLSVGTYSVTIEAKRTDSGSYNNSNAVSITKVETSDISDYSTEKSDKTMTFTKTFSITSASDTLYFYLYNSNSAFTYSGTITITKN